MLNCRTPSRLALGPLTRHGHPAPGCGRAPLPCPSCRVQSEALGPGWVVLPAALRGCRAPVGPRT